MKEPVGSQRTVTFAEPELLLSEPVDDDDMRLVARDLRGRVRLTHLNGRLRAAGQVRALVGGLRCSRCLEECRLPVSTPVDDLFLQTYDVPSGLPLRPGEGEEPDADTLVIDHNHMVDLGELLRQTLLVSLPIQPLCRADCRGLCPTCGQNWNEGPCDCDVETLDPRLAALAALLADETTAARFSSN
jgi:uncharacterized protein